MPVDNEVWAARYGQALMNTFGQPQRVLTHGQGARVWDSEGNLYLDLLAGIAVNALGHGHRELVETIAKQAENLMHVSNFFTSPPQVELAEALLGISVTGSAPRGSRVFFSNSGTEANEAALKMARVHGGRERPRVLALEGAFHGRTMGALALTHKIAYREPFEPLPGGIEFLPWGDEEALRAAVGTDVAALIIEPIQGEAGVRELPGSYLRLARELTEQNGALLVFDEVQSGTGRCGAWMAHHAIAPGVVPDVITLAKGLGGGFPIGAVVALGPVAAGLLQPGMHGTTFGGNPLACATALKVVEILGRDNLVEHARQTGLAWREKLRGAHPSIVEVRGRGLLIGIGLRDEIAPGVARALLEAGYIVNAANPRTVRLAPPLIIRASDCDPFVEALKRVLEEFESAADGGEAR